MKSRFLLPAGALIVTALMSVAAEGQTEDPREQLHREAYAATVRGEQSRDEGNLAGAVELFAVALSDYRKLAREYPAWRTKIVRARVNYCVTELENLLKNEELDRRFRARLDPLLKGGPGSTPAAADDAVVTDLSASIQEQDGIPADDDLRAMLAQPKGKKGKDDLQEKDEDDPDRARTAQLDRDADADTLRRELNRSEKENARLKAEYEDLRDDYDKLSRSKSGKGRDQELQLEVAALKEELAEISRLKSEGATPRASAESSPELEQLQKECEELKARNANLERRLAAKKSGKTDPADEVSSREAALLKEIERLRADIRKGGAKDAAPAAAPQSGEGRYQALRAELESLRAENASLRQKMSGASQPDDAADRQAATRDSGSPAAQAPADPAAEATRLLREGKYAEAHAVLDNALAARPDDIPLLYLRGTLACKEGDFPLAVKNLKKVADADQSDSRARVALGGAYFAMGDYTNARMELEMAVGFDPDLADAHFGLAQVLLMCSPPDPAAAKTHYAEALNLGATPDAQLEKRLEQALGKSAQADSSPFVPISSQR